MEIKINLHISADASVTSALLAIAAAMAGKQPTAVTTTPEATSEVKEPPTRPAMPRLEEREPQEPPGVTVAHESVATVVESEVRWQDVFGMTEKQLMALPTSKLLEALTEMGVDPNKTPGKNSNLKLRQLVLDYVSVQSGAEETPPIEEEEETTGQPEISDVEIPTREEFRMLMIPRVQSKDPRIKQAAIQAIKNTGFASIDEMYQRGTPEDILRAQAAVLNIKV